MISPIRSSKATAKAHPTATAAIGGNSAALLLAGALHLDGPQTSFLVGAFTAVPIIVSGIVTHGGVLGLWHRFWHGA